MMRSFIERASLAAALTLGAAPVAGCIPQPRAAVSLKVSAAAKTPSDAVVTIEPVEGKGNTITRSALTLVGDVPGISAEKFAELTAKAKAGCPVSRALGAIEITLDAKLAS